MEKKALIAIAFIIIVAFLINNAPKKPTQQKKLRAQTTETFDTDTINNSAIYDDSFNIIDDSLKTPKVTSRGFIQKLKSVLINLPVPNFVGPSILKETEFDPCATNRKSPIKQIKQRLPSSPSAWNR